MSPALSADDKPGWDVDGICNDHGRWLCSECAIPDVHTLPAEDKVLVERASAAYAPILFGDDPIAAHRMASPLTVEAAKDRIREQMRPIIEALSSLPAQPEGEFVVVPKVPTTAMLEAGADALVETAATGIHAEARAAWSAMLSAAPLKEMGNG